VVYCSLATSVLRLGSARLVSAGSAHFGSTRHGMVKHRWRGESFQHSANASQYLFLDRRLESCVFQCNSAGLNKLTQVLPEQTSDSSPFLNVICLGLSDIRISDELLPFYYYYSSYFQIVKQNKPVSVCCIQFQTHSSLFSALHPCAQAYSKPHETQITGQ
jgi:hypothetical protein